MLDRCVFKTVVFFHCFCDSSLFLILEWAKTGVSCPGVFMADWFFPQGFSLCWFTYQTYSKYVHFVCFLSLQISSCCTVEHVYLLAGNFVSRVQLYRTESVCFWSKVSFKLFYYKGYASVSYTNKQETEKSLNTSSKQDDSGTMRIEMLFISVLRKDTEYLNDLNMWSHQASLMLCAQKSLVCKWWWLDESQLFVSQLFVSQLFVSQLFVHQLFYWFWPFAASNIFLRPSMPDMASTFFLQSLTSTVFSCSTHRIHMRDMIFHSLPLILGENISRRPDVHILCTRGVNDYLY